MYAIKNQFGIYWWEDGVQAFLDGDKKDNLPHSLTEQELIESIAFDACVELFIRHWSTIFKTLNGITKFHIIWIKEIRSFRNTLYHAGYNTQDTEIVFRAFNTMNLFLKPIDSLASEKYTFLKSQIGSDGFLDFSVPNTELMLLPACPYIVDEWPIQILKKELITSSKTPKYQLIIEIKNVQSLVIEYLEINIFKFVDIVGRQVNNSHRAPIQRELSLQPGQIIAISEPIENYEPARDFELFLNVVKFNNREVKSYPKNIQKISVKNPTRLSTIIQAPTTMTFIKEYKVKNCIEDDAAYVHEGNIEGYWNCAFCGTVNSENQSACKCCLNSIENQKLFTSDIINASYFEWNTIKENESRINKEKQMKLVAEKNMRAEAAAKEKEIEQMVIAKQKKDQKEAKAKQIEEERRQAVALKVIGWILGIAFLGYLGVNAIEYVRLNVSIGTYIISSLIVDVAIFTIVSIVSDFSLDTDLGIIFGGVVFGVMIVLNVVFGIIIY